MMKLWILCFIIATGLPIGMVGARLLYRWGDMKIKQLQDKHNDRYLKP